MPYDLRWLEEEHRLIAIRLHDPLASYEAEQLMSELRAILETPRPVFLLADVLGFNAREGMAELMRLAQREPFPLDVSHLNRSRIALVGAERFASTVLSLMRSLTGKDLIRAFNHEDEALTWLRDQAGSIV